MIGSTKDYIFEVRYTLPTDPSVVKTCYFLYLSDAENFANRYKNTKGRVWVYTVDEYGDTELLKTFNGESEID